MSRLNNLTKLNAYTRELLKRYATAFKYSEQEIRKAKSVIDDIKSRPAIAKRRDDASKLEKANDALRTGTIYNNLKKSDKDRLDLLVQSFNTLGETFRLSLKRGDDLEGLLIRLDSMINKTISEHKADKSDKAIPYISKVLNLFDDIGNLNYRKALQELAEKEEVFESVTETKTDNGLYDDYIGIEEYYYTLLYPKLMSEEEAKLSPRGKEIEKMLTKESKADRLAGFYIGLALGSYFMDKKYDSLYLALGMLSEQGNLDKLIKEVKDVDGIFISKGDTERELILDLASLQIEGFRSYFHESLRELIDTGKYITFNIKDDSNASKTLRKLEDIMTSRPKAEEFEQDILSTADSKMFSYENRRGAIVGAVLGAYHGLDKIVKYYSLEIKEMMTILQDVKAKFNIMNLSNMLKVKI